MHSFDLLVIDTIATGRNIKKLRLDAGLTVGGLQELFGFSTPQAIYKWQRGEALPTLENMAILSRALRKPMEEILVFTRVQMSPAAAEKERK